MQTSSLKTYVWSGISINGKKIFDRKEFGGFPEIKELKQMVRDEVSPGKSLGHADTPSHHEG